MWRLARSAIRDLVGSILYSAGVTRPHAAGAERLTVVTFHRVLPEAQLREYPMPGLSVTPAQLEWFLRFFVRDFEVLPLRDAIAAWDGGRAATSRPLLAVTFDDAQRDNYLHARPVLARMGVRATFYVPVEAVEHQTLLWHDRLGYAVGALARSSNMAAAALLAEFAAGVQPSPARATQAAKTWPAERREQWIANACALLRDRYLPAWDGMMTWEQLRNMQHEGHEIGSHSWTHPILPTCSPAQLEREIVESKHVLQQRVDGEVATFCYPNGDFDARCIAMVREAGYCAAVTTSFGTNARGANVYALRRCDLQAETSSDRAGELSEARTAWRISPWFPGQARA